METLRNFSEISSRKSDYPPMFVDNEYIEDNKKKADAFNTFICNQAMVDDSNVNLPNITTPESSPFLSDIHITEEQVFDHLFVTRQWLSCSHYYNFLKPCCSTFHKLYV